MTDCARSAHESRIDAIQSFRAVAVLLVLATHAIITVIEHGGGSNAFVPAIPNLAGFGYSGVDLFFVISGFVMAHTLQEPRGVRRFAWSRFIRIWPLYALAIIVSLPLLDLSALDPRTVVTSLTLLPLADGAGYHAPMLTVGWTLGVEAIFYLLVASVIARRGSATLLLVLTMAATIAGLVVTPGWAPLRMLCNPVLGEFAAGVAIWIAWRAGVSAWSDAAIAFGAFALWAGVTQLLPIGVAMDPALTAAGQMGLSRTLAWGLPWALIVYGVVSKPPAKHAAYRVAQRIGDASYSIYLVHLSVIEATLCFRPDINPVTASGWIFALIGLALAAGLATHRLVERPLLAWLRRSTGRPSVSMINKTLPLVAH